MFKAEIQTLNYAANNTVDIIIRKKKLWFCPDSHFGG